MTYFLGIDNGGTMTKAALYDAAGRELCVESCETAMLTPAAGFVERDMEEMWEANCTVIRRVMASAGIDPADVACIGICGHGKGLYLWGKDGRPAGYGIISTDNRAYGYTDRWAADGTEEAAFALSCQHLMSCQPVALLAWMKDNRPDIYGNIRWVFECKDYIRFRLTGEAKAEVTDYSGTSLMNLHTRQFDPELLRLFGIEEIEEALPPLCASREIAGYVTAEAAEKCGLHPGTPVIGGMMDIDACALAAGILDDRNVCMIAGTWSINEYIRKTPVTDGSVKMNSLYCLPDYYLIEESSPTSAGNNEWFIRTLLPEVKEEAKRSGKTVFQVMDSWIQSIPPEKFVPLFLPFILGSNVHPNAKGTFAGISAEHGREHLTKSVYEGIAYCHRVHLEKLLASRQTPPDCIRLAGGAARSPVWTQMFADITGLPVERVEANETGALGCAIAGAAAVGAYSSLAEAAETMSKPADRILPDMAAHAAYTKRYELYCRLTRCLDPIWSDMQTLAEQ